MDISNIDYFTENTDRVVKCELSHVTPPNIHSDLLSSTFLEPGHFWTRIYPMGSSIMALVRWSVSPSFFKLCMKFEGI